MERKKALKLILYLVIVVVLIIAYNKGKESTEFKEGETYCEECGKHFKAGTGWYAIGNQIGTPDNEVSHFCSDLCAHKYLQK